MKSKIRVVRVEGDPYRRSMQHARALGDEALSASLDFYRRFWDIQGAQMLPGFPRWARRFLTGMIKALIVNPGARDSRLEQRDRDMLRGYAAGLGGAVSYTDLKKAAAVPDSYNYCLGWLFGMRKAKLPLPPALTRINRPGFAGCSSMIAWGEATADGGLIFGRNLDFFTGDEWIERTVLLVAEPGPGEIPFASVTSAGIPIEGITALNAEGLAVGVHQNFCTAVSTRGRSIIYITNEVAARAKTIGQAVDIVRKKLPVSGWTVIVGSAAEKSAVFIETNARRAEVVYPEAGKSYTCYANCYLSPSLQEHEYVPGYAIHEHNHARLLRMRQLLEEHAGGIDAAKMAVLLGDHFDPVAGQERPLGNTISAVHNVTSAVLEADRQRIWIARGPAPANTTASYTGFDLEAIRRGEEGNLGDIPGNPYFHHPAYPALRQYALAYQAFDDLDTPRVMEHLQQACALDPEEPIYAFMLGLFYLKAGRTEEALARFRQADQPCNSAYRSALARLWQARCCDLLGRRPEAEKLYRSVLEIAPQDSGLDLTARKGLRKPYKTRAVKGIIAEFLMGESHEI